MITIIYGDNTKESRQLLVSLLLERPAYVSLQYNQVNLTDLAQTLEGGSLFSESKTILIEDYLSKTKKSKERDAVLTYLDTQAKNNTIILWEGKDLSKTAYSLFSKPILKQCRLPQTIFQFLDAIRPKNGKELISLHHKTLRSSEPELLFFMLVRHIRTLLALSDPSPEAIDEVKRMAPWQKSKLERQAKILGPEKLLFLHSELYSLEKKHKTGALPSELPASIDFLLTAI